MALNLRRFDPALQAIQGQRMVKCRTCNHLITGITFCGFCIYCKGRQEQFALADDRFPVSFCTRHGGYVPITCKLPHAAGHIPSCCNKCEGRPLIGSPQDIVNAGYAGLNHPTRAAVTRYYRDVGVLDVFHAGELLH